MAVRRSSRRFSSARLTAVARRLLDASTLFALATVAPGGRAHVNTAYFAWNASFDIVWLSAPDARHSRNIHRDPSAAIAVFDSRQRWGGKDRGIQLFGRAVETRGRGASEAERLYARRFRDYEIGEYPAYRFYRFRPRRLKLFDERAFGGGVFVTARVTPRGLAWERTEELAGDD